MKMVSSWIKQCFPNVADYIYLRKVMQQNDRIINNLCSLKESEYPEFLRHEYGKKTGKRLDLQNPSRLTEKIQWRKLYDQDPLYSILSDKYSVRKWIEEKIGSEYLIPLLGVWDHFSDIDFQSLPDQFVLKTNNASHTNIIVTDKKAFMHRKWAAGKKIDYWLSMPFSYLEGLELHYREIKPKIIAELYIPPEPGKSELSDYKFHCFNGVPYLCQVISDRLARETIDFYDSNWEHVKIARIPYPNTEKPVDKPEHYDLMVLLATELSRGFKYVRVDLYNHAGKIYFGEMTFTPGSGYMVFDPDDWDYRLGELWDIHSEQIDKKLVGIDLNN